MKMKGEISPLIGDILFEDVTDKINELASTVNTISGRVAEIEKKILLMI